MSNGKTTIQRLPFEARLRSYRRDVLNVEKSIGEGRNRITREEADQRISNLRAFYNIPEKMICSGCGRELKEGDKLVELMSGFYCVTCGVARAQTEGEQGERA